MKQNFSFETNIEKRMPQTGKVFFVDRMTSDYAKAHPFNVDEYIHAVSEKHGADEERVRMFFYYGLGRMGEKYSTHCPAKHRDKIVKDPKTGIGDIVFGKFPSYVNGCEPALIEAWNKGAEYHTKGFRQGDLLPAIVPACKITRLEDGEWFALFPKEMHLLDDSHAEITETTESSTFVPTTDNTDGTDNIEPEINQCSPTPSEQNDAPSECPAVSPQVRHEPQQLDLFAQMQAEISELRMKNEELRMKNEDLCNMIQTRTAVRAAQDVLDAENCPCETQGQPSPTRRQRRERRREQDVMALHTSPAITVSHDDDDHSQRNMKIFAAVATAAVFLVLVNTVGLFGVAALGLLAGGLIK